MKPMRHTLTQIKAVCVVPTYIDEGHVSSADINRMIAERPAAKGVAEPGMDQPAEAYTVVLFRTPTGYHAYAKH